MYKNLDEEALCQILRTRKIQKKNIERDEEFLSLVLESLKDTRPRVRRYAAIAAGRESWSENASTYKIIEAALFKAWKLTPFDNEKRHIAESLGKLGGESSFELLESVKSEDALLNKSIAKALLLLERRFSKAHKTQWQMDNAFASPLPVRLWCRRGLESLLVRQFDGSEDVEVSKVGQAFIDVLLKSSPNVLFKNKVFINFGFPLLLKNPHALKNPKVIAESLFTKNTRQILATFSTPPYRIRIEHAGAGHQRSLQWKIAQEIADLSKTQGFSIINDSRQADWEALVSSYESAMFLCPKSFEDPRFSYRVSDVPAASHPTIAASLAHLADIQSEDIIWDPFVGSGTELIESYRSHPCKLLVGTDLEEKALQNTRANMEAAGVYKFAHLEKADALHFEMSKRFDVVITNPPMGRRVPIKGIEDLLCKFLRRLPHILSPKGCLVWMSPFPELLDRELLKLGFKKSFGSKVDMGGFSAELQKWVRT